MGDGQFLWPRRPPISALSNPADHGYRRSDCRWHDWQSEFSSIATGPMTFGRVPDRHRRPSAEGRYGQSLNPRTAARARAGARQACETVRADVLRLVEAPAVDEPHERPQRASGARYVR